MEAESALDLINELLTKQGDKRLNEIESLILREIWEDPKKTYKEIAFKAKYTEGSIDTIAYKIWQRLTNSFKVKFTKNRLREIVESYNRKSNDKLENRAILVSNASKTVSESFSHTDSYNNYEPFDLTKAERRKKYQKALEFIQAAGSVDNWHHLKLIIKAFNLYQQLEDVEQAAALINKTVDTPWKKREKIGVIAYRLGFMQEFCSAINWLIEKIEAGWYLPAITIGDLYNEGGDLIWMSSNHTHQAILFHQKSQEYGYKSRNTNLIIVSESNQALCNIDHGELERTINNINQGRKLIDSIGNFKEHQRFEVSFDCLSAFTETLIDGKQASELADMARFHLLDQNTLDKLNSWQRSNLPVYIAQAFLNIGYYDKAFEMYMKADCFAKASGCIQVEAKVLAGKAILHYLENKPFSIEKPMTWLQEAKKLFKLINAEGDQAYINLMLGVMFKELNKTQESQQHFREAEQFYLIRNMPQKIAKLNQIREENRLI